MISRAQRMTLSVPDGYIGFDCEGKVIRNNDILEVVVEGEFREGKKEWIFCSKGKRGKASRHFSFPAGWIVTVNFDPGGTVGCVDYHTRIVEST